MLVIAPVALQAASPVTLQAPVTIAGTFTYTGQATQTTAGASTTYQAKMITFRYGNKDLLSSLVDEKTIPSIDGWSIVARWTAADNNVFDYQLYAVKAGAAPVPLDSTDSSIDVSTEALAAGYNVKWTDGAPASGSGSYQSGVTASMTDNGDSMELAGIASGSYTIKAPVKNGTPIYFPGAVKMTLQGGAILSDNETVVSMTLTIGAAKVVAN